MRAHEASTRVSQRAAARRLAISQPSVAKLLAGRLLVPDGGGGVDGETLTALESRPFVSAVDDGMVSGLKGLVVQVGPATPLNPTERLDDGAWRLFSGWSARSPADIVTPFNEDLVDGVRGWWWELRGPPPKVLVAALAGFPVLLATVEGVDRRLPNGLVRYALSAPPPALCVSHAGKRLKPVRGPVQYSFPWPG